MATTVATASRSAEPNVPAPRVPAPLCIRNKGPKLNLDHPIQARESACIKSIKSLANQMAIRVLKGPVATVIALGSQGPTRCLSLFLI